jgi:hypothetical protein
MNPKQLAHQQSSARLYAERYDQFGREIGFRAPDPTLGVHPNDYRREVLRTLKKTYLQNHKLYSINMRGLPDDVLPQFEEQVLQAIRQEAYNPRNVPTGEIRRLDKLDEFGKLGANPRFVVTSLKRTRYDARALYEALYCARGEAENRIGEQFELFADRASTATFCRATNCVCGFSAMAYVLLDSLRRIGLRHSQFVDAAVATIRLNLLKLGAQVRTSVRRIHFALASGCPNKIEFELAYLYLRRAYNSS